MNTTERNVLVSHQFYLPVGGDAEKVDRMDSEIRTVGNIDAVSADVLELFDYAALGHIHKPMKVGSEVYRYCGTPLAWRARLSPSPSASGARRRGENGRSGMVSHFPDGTVAGGCDRLLLRLFQWGGHYF